MRNNGIRVCVAIEHLKNPGRTHMCYIQLINSFLAAFLKGSRLPDIFLLCTKVHTRKIYTYLKVGGEMLNCFFSLWRRRGLSPYL